MGWKGIAHADSGWRRQVSLLAMESIAKARQLGMEVGPGDFAENIGCAIMKQTGNCIMPKEGVFAKRSKRRTSR